MSRMQWKPLPGYLKLVLKKNRKNLYRIALLFSLLNTCAPFNDESPIIVSVSFSSGENAMLNITTQWNGLGDHFFDQSADPKLERTIGYIMLVGYNLPVRYGTSVRAQPFFSESISGMRQTSIAYDPYTKLYYLNGLEQQDEMHFANPAELRDYLRQPVTFVFPAEDLLPLREEELTIRVRGYVSRLSEDSTFQRWLRSFNPYEYEGYGEIQGGVNE